jgi:hypothetical protein
VINMSIEKAGEITRSVRNEYLITWSLTLGRDELAKISSRPKALTKALRYVEGVARENELEIYRFVPVEELTHHKRLPAGQMNSAHSSGIAIAKAASLDEAARQIREWVEGLSYGGMPVGDYLEYEIKPMAKIGQKGRG